MQPLTGHFDISFYHKNTARKAEGKTPLKNVVPFNSHVPKHQHFGRIIGALHQARTATCDLTNQAKAYDTILKEFRASGLQPSLEDQALLHFFDIKRTHTYEHTHTVTGRV